MLISKKEYDILCQCKEDWEKLAQSYKEKCDILEGLLEKYEALDAMKDAQIERLLNLVKELALKGRRNDVL